LSISLRRVSHHRTRGFGTGAERGGDTSGDATTGGTYQDPWHFAPLLFNRIASITLLTNIHLKPARTLDNTPPHSHSIILSDHNALI